jgi:hypothetical protein
MTSERRDFQRLVLDDSLPALLGVRNVRILDITLHAAGIAYEGPEIDEGVCSRLAFTWHGDLIDLPVQVSRTTATADGFLSGLVFQRHEPDTLTRVRNLMLLSATQQLTRRRIAMEPGFSLDAETTAMRAPYLALHLIDDVWDRKRTFSARQPRTGFTVLAGIGEMDLQRLCVAFRQADVISRQLIRVLAELAIAEAHQRENAYDFRVVDAPAIF